jgi:hypothetical protein
MRRAITAVAKRFSGGIVALAAVARRQHLRP